MTVTDAAGGSATATALIDVADVSPVPTGVMVTPAVDEGGVVSLTGRVENAGRDALTLVVDWGEGDPETIALSPEAESFAVSHRYLDDSPSGTTADAFAIRVRLLDDDGGEVEGQVETVVSNIAPTATVSGSPVGVPGVPVGFTAAFTDPGVLDTHEVAWDFGDGTAVTYWPVTEPGALAPSHVYARPGTFEVTWRVRDDDGGVGVAARTVTIQAAGLQPDPEDPTKTALVVGDERPRRDQVRHRQAVGRGEGHDQPGHPGAVRADGAADRHGLGRNDDIAVDGAIRLPVEFYGGDGHDTLRAGKGSGILVGGPGNDQLTAGTARDLLIGGGGADRVAGAGDDDILIAGTTRYDDDPRALRSLMTEWTRTDVGYAGRVEHLRNGGGRNGLVRLDALAVADDGANDRLTGGPGIDWFLAGTGDRVSGRKAPEIQTVESPSAIAIAWSSPAPTLSVLSALESPAFARPAMPEFAIQDDLDGVTA